MAACLLTHSRDWNIDIPEVEDVDGVTVYKILVRIGVVCWEVKHRYREFHKLHEKLVSDHGMTKDCLPPKKLLNNKDPKFIEKRRTDLETYLTNALSLLMKALPEELVEFLALDKFDIILTVKRISNNLKKISKFQSSYELDSLEIHALSERLTLPCPPKDLTGLQHDFSIVLDFCSNLTMLTIVGYKTSINNSNIKNNILKYELSPFKSLAHLILKKVDPENIKKADELRKKLKALTVVECDLKNISSILLCDSVHKHLKLVTPENQWNLTEVDFSYNVLSSLDDTLMLLPKTENLNLSCNKLVDITRICDMELLVRLNLSMNKISNIECLKGHLKKLVFLDLSQNNIKSLNGLQELPSLQGLNIAYNSVNELTEIDYIIDLPCLDYIVFTGNPISLMVDYRVKILERFGPRATKVCLDNEQSTRQELDTVAILQTLRFVKEGRSPNFKNSPSYVYGSS